MNVSDNDGNTALHIVFINKSAQPLSDFTPQMNKVHLALFGCYLPDKQFSIIIHFSFSCESSITRIKFMLGAQMAFFSVQL